MTEAEAQLLEQLKRLQAQISRVEEKLDELAAEIRGAKRRVATGLAPEVERGAGLGSVMVRLEREKPQSDPTD